MAHPIDTLHLKVALSAVFILAALAANSILDLPFCWTPSEFTSAQVAYTRNTCGDNTTRTMNKGWVFPRLLLNLTAEAVAAVAIYFLCCHVASLASTDSVILKTAWKKAASGKLALPVDDRIGQLLRSSNIAMLYFFTQLLAFTLWFLAFFFIQDIPENMPAMSLPPPHQDLIHTSADPNTFLCQFQIRRLGNIVRYTIQCQPPTYASLRLAVTGNKSLCLLMALATAAHICYTFIFTPLIQRRNAQMIVDAVEDPQVRLGWNYGLTDLYMVGALSPTASTNKDDKDKGC